MSFTQAVLTRTKDALGRVSHGAPERGWLLIDRARNWKVMHPPAD
jgi:hypothetical protein